MNIQNSPIEKVSNWIKKSITLKLATITFLMLLLLIPTSMVESIIHERENMRWSAISEVSSKWAEKQQITGPILTIPIIYEYHKEDKVEQSIKYMHILPEKLDFKGDITPKKLRRGIYEIVVYSSDFSVSGSFKLNQSPDSTNLKRIKYESAFLTLGISDLRGIEEEIDFKWNKNPIEVKPGSRIPNISYSGVTIDLPGLKDKTDEILNFNFDLKLQGSQNISFLPLGNTTTVKLESVWTSPSFNGSFLPDQREVNEKGFSAYWKILQLNRNLPPYWLGNIEKEKLHKSAFGVDLILPIDDYQKSMRSAKYAVMTITLTFLIFFLVEIINGRKIHPFQYALVGFALSLFYVLLVSISEHSNFNLAYTISSIVVVGMITLYSLSVFKAFRLSMLLTATLISIYGFLFTTLQLTDYALLMGSIGLTIILAATMYFTRNINWYKLNIETE